MKGDFHKDKSRSVLNICGMNLAVLQPGTSWKVASYIYLFIGLYKYLNATLTTYAKQWLNILKTAMSVISNHSTEFSL